MTIALQPANSSTETSTLEHSAESLHQWLDQLEQRFSARPVAGAMVPFQIADDAEPSVSATPRHGLSHWNRNALAGFAAAGLFGEFGCECSHSRPRRLSAAPEGQGEDSPGQRSAATAALGNQPPTPIFMIASLPRAALRLPWAIIFRPDRARCSPRYVEVKTPPTKAEVRVTATGRRYGRRWNGAQGRWAGGLAVALGRAVLWVGPRRWYAIMIR
jgi:hypothetical protein